MSVAGIREAYNRLAAFLGLRQAVHRPIERIEICRCGTRCGTRCCTVVAPWHQAV